MIRDYLRKIRHEFLFCSNDRKLSQDLIYLKKCYSIIWSTTELVDRWRFWGFSIGFLFNLISIVCGLFWSLVRVTDTNFMDSIDLAETLLWTIIGMFEILQICDACSRVVNAVSYCFVTCLILENFFSS